MNVYIFASVDELTDNYHSGGGLVVVARDADHVKELIADREYTRLTQPEWDKVITYPTAGDAEPKIYVFPDAGCC